MGGRRASSSGSGRVASISVSSVTGQGGVEIDLKNNPLVYGQKANLSPAIRQKVDEFENKHLAHKTEYGMLLDAQGNTLIEENGGKNSVGMPQYLYNRAEVMTHNHPRSGAEVGELGGTFSHADLDAFTGTYVQTMRASAAEGVYSITKSNTFDPISFMSYEKKVRADARAAQNQKNASAAQKLFSGDISYDEYQSAKKSNFNAFLVDVHNGLIAGQNQYGYTYALERRN